MPDRPSVARAGPDTPWQVTVTHPGGFGKQVTRDHRRLLQHLRDPGFHPEPADETRDAHTLSLTFTAPPGDTFVVDFDAYIQPASQQGRSATLAVMDGATPAVSVDVDTRLMP